MGFQRLGRVWLGLVFIGLKIDVHLNWFGLDSLLLGWFEMSEMVRSGSIWLGVVCQVSIGSVNISWDLVSAGLVWIDRFGVIPGETNYRLSRHLRYF